MTIKGLRKAIYELAREFQGNRVEWVDRSGRHLDTWEAFESAMFSAIPEIKEPISRDKCPLLEFDMGQLAPLGDAAKECVCDMLMWIGFPAMEKKNGAWYIKSGVVRLDGLDHSSLEKGGCETGNQRRRY